MKPAAVSTLLKLEPYNGKMLTAAEILLTKFHECRHAEKKKAEEDKEFERKLLSSRAYPALPIPAPKPAPSTQISISATSAAPASKSQEQEKTKAAKEQQQQKLQPKTKQLGTAGWEDMQVDKSESESDDEEAEAEFDVDIKAAAKTPAAAAKGARKAVIKAAPATQTQTPAADAVEPSGPLPVVTIKRRQVNDDEDDVAVLPTASASEPAGKKKALSKSMTLFCNEGLLSNSDWNPKTEKVTKEYILTDFGLLPGQSQTLAFKLTVPPGSDRWSVNISPQMHDDLTDILLHFNPRYKKQELLLTDKQGCWGYPTKRNMSSSHSHGDSGLMSSSVELVFHVKAEGFAIFVNNHFNSFFPHRRPIERYSSLSLTFPATDDNGRPENVVFHKVWWGYRDPNLYVVPARILSKAALPSDPAGPRTMVVRNLPVLHNPAELQELEAALLGLFEQHSPETVVVVLGKGVGFVKLESEEHAQEAFKELQGSAISDNFLQLSIYDDSQTYTSSSSSAVAT